MRYMPCSLTLLDWSLGQEVDPTVLWSEVTVSSQPYKNELNSNLKTTERLPDILAIEQPGTPSALWSPLSRVWAMAHTRFSKVKDVLILKAEYTVQLRWAHMVSCREEKAHQHMQLLHKAIEHRCQEIDKEMDTLGKFLEKVKTSTGHLTQSCQHEWSDRSLPKEQSQRKRHWLPLPRATFFLFDGVTSGIHEHLLFLWFSMFITFWRTPWESSKYQALEENAGKPDGICFLGLGNEIRCEF